jgi:hypothetical protein
LGEDTGTEVVVRELGTEGGLLSVKEGNPWVNPVLPKVKIKTIAIKQKITFLIL